jgi:DNA polymerase III gamma/tau subunit
MLNHYDHILEVSMMNLILAIVSNDYKNNLNAINIHSKRVIFPKSYENNLIESIRNLILEDELKDYVNNSIASIRSILEDELDDYKNNSIASIHYSILEDVLID